MMKQILKAGPNQTETLRRLRTEAAAIDKDVTVRSERIRLDAGYSYPLLVS